MRRRRSNVGPNAQVQATVIALLAVVLFYQLLRFAS